MGTDFKSVPIRYESNMKIERRKTKKRTLNIHKFSESHLALRGEKSGKLFRRARSRLTESAL